MRRATKIDPQNFGTSKAIDPELFTKYNVKRGLRNMDGTGVVAGITQITDVHGYSLQDGTFIPEEGKLTLRGYDIKDLVESIVADERFGYEELIFLLWSGKLPAKEDLRIFQKRIDHWRDLPNGFVSGLIMNSPSHNTMNMLARSILLLYANDPNADDSSMIHEVDVALSLISRLPRLAALGYLTGAHTRDMPLYINPPKEGLSTAQTILFMLRQDMSWRDEEAKMLDIMLMLHAEHGGGNNSTFTTRVLTSSGTDPYSAYAGGVSSLKGSRHGGANIKAEQMQEDLKAHVRDWSNEGQVADYLRAVLRREANDGSGLIYGMGHAVYTLSDPRAVICKQYAEKLVKGTEFEADLELIETIERLSPVLFKEVKGSNKPICANIDMYSGMVYRAMGIPQGLYTPLFAVARMAGWAAHRFEEIETGKRIMRPAYKSLMDTNDYLPLDKRNRIIPKAVKKRIDHDADFPSD